MTCSTNKQPPLIKEKTKEEYEENKGLLEKLGQHFSSALVFCLFLNKRLLQIDLFCYFPGLNQPATLKLVNNVS